MSKESELLASGLFEIDKLGRVWRIAKRHGRGVKLGGGYHKGAAISPCRRVRAEFKNGRGYLQVTATIDGKKIICGAHRLVWVSLHGEIPRGLTINHENGEKTDNRPTNLSLMTQSEQRIHAIGVLNVNRNRPKGSKHPKTSLQERDVLRIRELRQSGVMVKTIAELYGMKSRAVSAICRGRTWTHI